MNKLQYLKRGVGNKEECMISLWGKIGNQEYNWHDLWEFISYLTKIS